MGFRTQIKNVLAALIVIGAVGLTAFAAPSPIELPVAMAKGGNLGVIKGIVRDNSGSPIADATVAIFRVGTSKLLKQVQSASDGSFLAKVLPGTYTVLAVAEGFNPVTLASIEVNRASQLSYGFKLERSGSGNTLPEKRRDRNNPKWNVRAAAISRSVYQNSEGTVAVDADEVDTVVETADDVAESSNRQGQTVVESYFAGSDSGVNAGFNVATLLPVADNAEIVFAGQVGVGKHAPLRFETQIKYRPTDTHHLRLNTSFGTLGSFSTGNDEKTLSQFSAQVSDEWKVREGVILVFGVDYARFVGAGDDFSLSPRLGLQYDIDSKTRFRAAYTSQTENRTWSRAIELEDAQVLFRDPAIMQDFVVEGGKPRLNKSRRLEFGIERVLDNRSVVEANVFFDTTFNRGIGMTSLTFDSLDQAGFQEFTANQQGNAQGLRVVYSRRLSGRFSAAAGYSFGVGQKLSDEGISNPAELFQNDVFQTFFGQFEADLRTGTNVKTVFRLSPQATVFAIDPFQGRLAIYDPSLSVLVTQNLPTLGLPFHAEAIVDARNLFGFNIGAIGEEGTLRMNHQRRALRGGILVRF